MMTDNETLKSLVCQIGRDLDEKDFAGWPAVLGMAEHLATREGYVGGVTPLRQKTTDPNGHCVTWRDGVQGKIVAKAEGADLKTCRTEAVTKVLEKILAKRERTTA